MFAVEEIQKLLKQEALDGWLFFDHHQRDPLAYRVLKFEPPRAPTRRWYYLIPAQGEARGLVHRIESDMLAALPGRKESYAGWSEQRDGLARLLGGCRRVAMQYSPLCAVPYVSMVDGGTVDLVRSTGVEVASSANLIQHFEARWTAEQLASHLEAGRRVDGIRRAAFERIGACQRRREAVSEWDIKSFILEQFRAQGMVTDHGPIVAVNANAANPHYEPDAGSSRAIRAGDLVLIDLWARLAEEGSVYYDVTWTGYCGPAPPSNIQNVFEIVRGARDAAVEHVQRAFGAGRPLCGYEVDDVARGFIRERGFGDAFFHRTGHSIGMDVHGAGANMDNLETHDERRIIPWTCFSIEPGIYLSDFGVRSEVNVFAGDVEAQVTGEVQQSLVRI